MIKTNFLSSIITASLLCFPLIAVQAEESSDVKISTDATKSSTAKKKEAQQIDAQQLVRNAIEHWRGTTSIAEMSMTIHRPEWERKMSMKAWTKGDDDSLVRVTAPKKDEGNGTLLINDNMWSFSPKINRIIKIPSSMMNQSWMGSDFSNKDIAKADDLVELYSHKLINTETIDGFDIYTIEAIPHEDSAVVWGKEIIKIRSDYILLEEHFYDQDNILVKSMTTSKIEEMDGRTVASVQRMQKKETPNEWTEISIQSSLFNVDIPKNTFTLSNLRNPRD